MIKKRGLVKERETQNIDDDSSLALKMKFANMQIICRLAIKGKYWFNN